MFFDTSPEIAEVCAIITFKLGAKRSSSEAQLASSEAGATSRLGLPYPVFWTCFFSTSSSESTCMVLPRPMSSARHAPSPSFASR